MNGLQPRAFVVGVPNVAASCAIQDSCSGQEDSDVLIPAAGGGVGASEGAGAGGGLADDVVMEDPYIHELSSDMEDVGTLEDAPLEEDNNPALDSDSAFIQGEVFGPDGALRCSHWKTTIQGSAV